MKDKTGILRLGGGAAMAEDRIEPAIELAENGNLDYLIFDSLSEKTMNVHAKQKREDPSKGYDIHLEKRMRAILPVCAKNGVKIIGNMGSVNPKAAVDFIVELAQALGLKGLKIAAVLGDDVLSSIKELNPNVVESGERLDRFGETLISANAYLPANGIVEALKMGADVVITGRVGDSSMFLAAMEYEFGWKDCDWDLVAAGVIIGHLLECGGQVAGGYFADPPYKVVPNLERLGFPIAEVHPNGEAIITKIPGTGGFVTTATCTEQLLYETDNPSCFIVGDVVADFSKIKFEEVGSDRIKVSGVKGKAKPENLKVCLGVEEGFACDIMIFYGGPGAYERAKLAGEIVKKRLERLDLQVSDLRIELIGINALYGPDFEVPGSAPIEVGLRVAGRTTKRSEAIEIGYEVGTLPTNGPAAPTCNDVKEGVREITGYATTFIPRDKIKTEILIRGV